MAKKLNFNEEERKAWDMFAVSFISDNRINPEKAAAHADEMIKLRRERFGERPATLEVTVETE